MKLEQLYYFQEAVKYRSISVAAKQNYISQSSFSGAISRLEQELGAPLLTRTNTGVEPTELGRLALEKKLKDSVIVFDVLCGDEKKHAE